MEYNKKTALQDMLNFQLMFQREMFEKRKVIAPDSPVPKHITAQSACYHATCANIEFGELVEQLNLDKWQRTEKVKFELIDVLLFVLNEVLFAQLKPKKTLQEYWNEAKEENLQRASKLYVDRLNQIIGNWNVLNGLLLHKIEFKNWKAYDVNAKRDEEVIEERLDKMLVAFMEAYVELNMKPADIFKYYCEKNKENIARQLAGGIYEK